MAEILIVDDDEQFCAMLARHVSQAGHGVSVTHTVADGAEKAQSCAYDVVFLDVNLPDGSGLDALQLFREGLVPPEIIIATGFGDANGAELAMRSGVWDYIGKESSMDAIRLSLARALQYREGKHVAAQRVALRTDLTGDSPRFRACLDLVAQAAGSDANVLITGETGTGKELVARTIHENSPRAEGRFVVVDCTALPETLVEGMLLGHEKGVFTGADRAREGLVMEADGGTLFLDEVGELPMDVQKTFLRTLQERSFRPLGASGEVTSDFRLLAATNRDLESMAEAGQFRRDLLYRLRSLAIAVPPLRERKTDVQALAAFMVDQQCRLHGFGGKGVAPDFEDALQAYDWPGNVRELGNAIESAVLAAKNEAVLYGMHLPTHIRVAVAKSGFPIQERSPREPGVAAALDGPLLTLKESRKQFDKRYLETLVAQSGGDIDAAARVSGLSRGHLYGLLREHGLSLR